MWIWVRRSPTEIYKFLCFETKNYNKDTRLVVEIRIVYLKREKTLTRMEVSKMLENVHVRKVLIITNHQNLEFGESTLLSEQYTLSTICNCGRKGFRVFLPPGLFHMLILGSLCFWLYSSIAYIQKLLKIGQAIFTMVK